MQEVKETEDRQRDHNSKISNEKMSLVIYSCKKHENFANKYIKCGYFGAIVSGRNNIT